MSLLADHLNLAPATLDRARQLHREGTITLLAVSGKLASGKDTIAAATMAELGHTDVVHFSYADAIKDEVDQIIATTRGTAAGTAAAQVAATQQVDAADAELMVNLLAAEAAADPTLHARRRTPGVRAALQHWGTQVRRTQDPDYWVKRSVSAAVATAAQGQSVFYTDVRFPNEVAWLADVGFCTVRVDVTADTQAQRLRARDGLLPDPGTVTHASETALDDYDRFDLRISNDGPLDATVSAVVAGLTAARTATEPAVRTAAVHNTAEL